MPEFHNLNSTALVGVFPPRAFSDREAAASAPALAEEQRVAVTDAPAAEQLAAEAVRCDSVRAGLAQPRAAGSAQRDASLASLVDFPADGSSPVDLVEADSLAVDSVVTGAWAGLVAADWPRARADSSLVEPAVQDGWAAQEPAARSAAGLRDDSSVVKEAELAVRAGRHSRGPRAFQDAQR